MFTHATPASPTLATTTSSAQPSSPVRPSRLRGLSYLRNYTHNLSHSHSRDNSANATANTNNQATSTSNAAPPASLVRRASLSRTPSYPGVGSNTSQAQAQAASVPSFGSSMASQVAPVTQAIAQNELAQATPASTMNNATINSARQWLGEPRRASGLPNGVQAATTGVQPSTTSAFAADPRTQLVRAVSMAGQAALRETGADAPVIGNNVLAVVNNPSPPPPQDSRPTIKFSQHQDPRAPRPSLMFTPMGRTLPTGTEIIKVGRYSERETAPNQPANMSTAAPVGFKSKVVSRRHCEFWVENGQWFIKDVKSSSGTFLNHVRLSPPNTESRPYPVKDGDIVQLGIDFKGGEEMIFRCVKIRVEVNRGWQAGLNSFNVASHKMLKKMTKAGGEGASNSDCSICLSAVAPCQALFVAPCSHTWHYKCIRPVLDGPHFPHFTCPNCRAVADLDADVDEPTEGEWEELDLALEQSQAVASPTAAAAAVAAPAPAAEEEAAQPSTITAPARPLSAHREVEPTVVSNLVDFSTLTGPNTNGLSLPSMSNDRARSTSANRDRSPLPSSSPFQHDPSENTRPAHLSTPIAISDPSRISGEARRGRESPEQRSPQDPVDNPMTPRNDVGPFVFDGSAIRDLNLSSNNPFLDRRSEPSS